MKYTDKQMFAVCIALIAIVFIIDLQIPLGVAGGVPYITVILVSLRLTNKNQTYYFAAICTLMVILGFYLSPAGGELWKVIFNRALAVFAIWATALLAVGWKNKSEEISDLKQAIQAEKEKIYLATINGAQHITYNLLNQLQLVELEIAKHPSFDKNVISMFNEMKGETHSLMNELSSVDNIDEEIIKTAIFPAKKPDKELKTSKAK